jgi:uncharacterized membrane protein
MVIMALDHSRDFFSLGVVLSAPTDIYLSNMEIFLTRWITHFAAPVFIFLAGIGLFFASGRRTKSELAYLAFTRGLWLIFLELTVVGYFWTFSADFYYNPKVAVLFAIGVAMIGMSLLVYLPRWLIGIITAIILLGHNMLDGINPAVFGEYAWLWSLAHVPGIINFGEMEIRVVYPLVPWIGVMALGYLFGPVTKMLRVQRRKIFLLWGATFFLLSLVLRWNNIYGDARIWSTQATLEQSIMSFLDFTKYPPSLIFLLFLIGFAMILMSIFDKPLGSWSKPFKNFGQVPFFFYILHIPILHTGGIILALLVFNDTTWLTQTPIGPSPEGYSYGFDLLPTYIAWIAVVVMLYLPSKWFAGLKARRKDWWLSYF